MPRVLLAGRIHDDGMALLRSRPDLVIEEMEDMGPAAFVRRLPEVDALLVHRSAYDRRVCAVQFRLDVRVGHDRGCETHVLVGLLACVRREPPWLAEEQRRSWRHARFLRIRRRSGRSLRGRSQREEDESDRR